MSTLDSLFIVRSPLQIINSLEAIEYFKLKNNILIIIYNNTNNTNSQMDNLVSLYKWKKIIKINEKKKKSKYFEYISFVKKIQLKKYNYLFFSNLGSFHKLLLANIQRERTIYIDDGVETITRYHNVFLPNKLNKIALRQLRFLIAGLKISIKDNIDFFTYFDLDNFRSSKIIRNDLRHFKKNYLQESKIDNTVYFLGQPLVTTNLLNFNDYFSYIDLLRSTYEEKIVYIPHRTEIISDKLQSYISEKFEIRDINMPVELYFLENKIYPKHIISFMTTALFTLKKLYSNSSFSYIYIPSNKILERKGDVKGAYKFIEKLDLNKITLR